MHHWILALALSVGLLSQLSAAEDDDEAGSDKVLARIDTENILVSDVAAYTDAVIFRAAGRIQQNNAEAIRKQLSKQRLESPIDVKLVVLDARQRLSEKQLMLAMLRLSRVFHAQELPKMMRLEDARSADDLNALLRQRHTSLERQKQLFVEQELARSWIAQQFGLQPMSREERKARIQAYMSQLRKPGTVKMLNGD